MNQNQQIYKIRVVRKSLFDDRIWYEKVYLDFNAYSDDGWAKYSCTRVDLVLIHIFWQQYRTMYLGTALLNLVLEWFLKHASCMMKKCETQLHHHHNQHASAWRNRFDFWTFQNTGDTVTRVLSLVQYTYSCCISTCTIVNFPCRSQKCIKIW